nr:MAG: hypothetical protein BEN19_00425 [Epulopiscium sp. Nuni2H_MBin003]
MNQIEMQKNDIKGIIVIDPGHGGYDPGKVGSNGVYEKNINLDISLKLRDYLEDNGYKIILTRDTDCDLDNIPDKFHKNNDMRARKDIINSSKAQVLVSIHQNAFSQESVRGAQVFYYSDTGSGKTLANFVQTSIREKVDPNNTRPIKNSPDYFLLKTSDMPAIIIECGFLTNKEEERMLLNAEYQSLIAGAIGDGIIQFLTTSS